MNSTTARALLAAAVGTALLAWLWTLGVRFLLLWMVGTAVAAFVVAVPPLAWRGIAGLLDRVRERLWAGEQGRHHSFAGVPLRVEDDGRHVWVDGAGLMRATGQAEPEDALAARHAGHWRRAPDRTLMLRVDAVVQQLNTGRDRDAPRIQRLRRYFERDVLFPAAQRRRRG